MQARMPRQVVGVAWMAHRLEAEEGLFAWGDAVALDFQFHLLIAESTGNLYFTDIMRRLGTSIIARTRLNSTRIAHDDQEHSMARLSREHKQMFEAIARQDSDAARAAMRLHLTNSRERLRLAHEAIEVQAPQA
jgi:GntR family transcriptional regulator, transcriptional repressor for pyruvate dehydrogenase complex